MNSCPGGISATAMPIVRRFKINKFMVLTWLGFYVNVKLTLGFRDVLKALGARE